MLRFPVLSSYCPISKHCLSTATFCLMKTIIQCRAICGRTNIISTKRMFKFNDFCILYLVTQKVMQRCFDHFRAIWITQYWAIIGLYRPIISDCKTMGAFYCSIQCYLHDVKPWPWPGRDPTASFSRPHPHPGSNFFFLQYLFVNSICICVLKMICWLYFPLKNRE